MRTNCVTSLACMMSRPAAALPCLLMVALLAAAPGVAFADREVPVLAARVNDLAGMLSEATEAGLEAELAALEETTGTQVAVLTVPSLEGDVLEDYSLRVAEAWKLGRGQFDDGALLLIARDERQMRLEVGYGLEGTIPDAYAKRILDDVMRPHFRNGDFDAGVAAAVQSIGGLIRGDESLPPPGPTGSAPVGDHSPLISFLFFLVPVGLFSLQALNAHGGAAWFLYFFLMPFWLLFPLAIFGSPLGFVPFAAWVVGFPILRKLFGGGGGGPTAGPRTRSAPGPFFGPGGGWSSSRGGFGGGFGGFSGGGGGFGGGGASGSW